MSFRSSIFSSETLAEGPRPTRAFVLALAIVVLARLALGMGSEAMMVIPAESADTRFFDVEQRVRRANIRPRVLLMGTSFAYYGLHGATFAAEVHLPREDVVNVAVNGGTPFETKYMLARNPQLLSHAGLVVIDLTRSILNTRVSVRPLFYRFASLDERLALDTFGDRSAAVIDVALQNLREKRPVDYWAQGLYRLFRPRRPEPPTLEPPRPLWQMTPEQRSRSLRRFDAVATARRQMSDFGTSSAARVFGDDFARFCTDRHLRLVILAMPTQDAYRNAFADIPGALEADKAYFGWLNSYSDRATILIYNTPESAGVSPEEFMDYGHLTEAGAMQVTRTLAKDLMAHGLFPLE